MQILDGEIIGSRAATFLEYVDEMGQGGIVSRREMAQRMGVNYSTARYNLERAVSEGYLNKRYGYVTEHQPGWLYEWKMSMPQPKGFEDEN